MTKRIVAVGGQSVMIDHRRLTVDGVGRTEPYVAAQSSDSWPFFSKISATRSVSVPSGHYFMLSDRRSGTLDSRSFGPRPEDAVIGVVLATVRHSHVAEFTPWIQ